MGDADYTDRPPQTADETGMTTREPISVGLTMSLSRPTWVRYQVLGVACIVAVIVYIHRQGFAVALPYIKADLHLNARQVSWLTAIFLLAYGGFEIPCGVIGDKLGTRHLLTILVLGWSLTTGLVALAVFLPMVQLPGELTAALLFLLAVRFLFGMFQAGAFPSLSRMMTDWMTMRERASAQGLIWMSTRIGGLVVPYLILFLVYVLGGWQAAIWGLAVLGFLWGGFFWFWFRNQPEEMPAVNWAERELIAAGRPARLVGHHRLPWRKMLRSRSVWSLCLLYMFGGFAANFYVTLLPTYLQDQRGVSKTATAVLASLPFLLGAGSCLAGGLLSDWIIRRTGNRKWGRRLNGTVGTLVGGLAWACLGWADDFWSLGFLLCLIFFCNDMAMGPVWACCADIGERYAGTLGGAMNMMGNLAGAVGNLVAGELFGKDFLFHALGADIPLTGSQLLFIIYACSYWLGTLSWQGVDVTKTLADQP
jgi:sugar phosphate permease